MFSIKSNMVLKARLSGLHPNLSNGDHEKLYKKDLI